jgi:hypothetical protein
MLRRSRCRGSESEGLGSALDAELKQDGCRPPDGRQYSTCPRAVQTPAVRSSSPRDPLTGLGLLPLSAERQTPETVDMVTKRRLHLVGVP